MRIVFVLPPVNMSGGIKVVAIYARLLTDMGHQVVLISPPTKETPFHEKLKSFLKGKGWPAVQKKDRKSHLDGTGLDHRVLDYFRIPTDDDVPDADVIIATWWETAEWVNRLNDSKGAKVYFIQGHEVHEHLPVERSRLTYHLPLHKIVIARWLQDVMSTEYGDRIVDVVPNSVDHDQFYAESRGKQSIPTIGFLYSPTHLKGVDVTLKAISILHKKIPVLRVISFGTYTLGQGVRTDENIEFYHAPAQESIRNLYSQCDVWVTASRTEGFNLPAMEAMACRTPVVSTRTGWPEEAVIDHENGFLVDVDDVDTLANRVASVLSLTDEAWERMSQNAFDTVTDSSWSASAKMFESALSNACLRAQRGEIAGSCTGLT